VVAIMQRGTLAAILGILGWSASMVGLCYFGVPCAATNSCNGGHLFIVGFIGLGLVVPFFVIPSLMMGRSDGQR
jgi:hypothetical protein